MKKVKKIGYKEVEELRCNDKKAYRTIMKKKLFTEGMKLMVGSTILLLLLYYSYKDVEGFVRQIPMNHFEIIMTFTKVMFGIGSFSCFLSFIQKTEEDEH